MQARCSDGLAGVLSTLVLHRNASPAYALRTPCPVGQMTHRVRFYLVRWGQDGARQAFRVYLLVLSRAALAIRGAGRKSGWRS